MFHNINALWIVLLMVPCFGCQNEQLAKLQTDMANLRKELKDQQTAAAKDADTKIATLSETQQKLETKMASDIKNLLDSYSPEMRDQLQQNIEAASSSKTAIETSKQEAEKFLQHVSELVKQVESQQEQSVVAATEIEKLRATTGGNGRYQLITGGEFSRSVGGGSRDPLTSNPGLASLYIVAVVDTSNARMMVQASCTEPSENAGANYEFEKWIGVPPPSDLPASIGRYEASIESGLGGDSGWYAIIRVLDTATGKMYRSTMVVGQDAENKKTSMLAPWEQIENPHVKQVGEQNK